MNYNTMATSNYGVSWDINSSSPTLTRIGNMELHQASSLPVHNAMRGCLLNDDGTVNYYLSNSNFNFRENGTTPSNLTGADGQVMVEIPEHWVRMDISRNTYSIQVSLYEIYGYTKVEKQYISVYEASLERSTSKLSSVKNTTINYRGGNNNSSWDSENRTLLGKAVTGISLTNFRNYAKNRGDKWNCHTYDAQFILHYLFLIEYATRYNQDDVNSTLTSEGYRQGGLGAGLTTVLSANWNAYNSYYPLVPIGYTDTMGMGSGEMSYTLIGFDGGANQNVMVNRYRGVELPFGHLFKWTDGLLINIQPNDMGGESTLYRCFNGKYASTITNDYHKVGILPRNEQYMRNVLFGTGGFMPSEVSASATTYWTDYWYTSIPTGSDSLRGVRFGGNASSGATAGFGCAYSNNAPSNTSAYFGSRLCFKN